MCPRVGHVRQCVVGQEFCRLTERGARCLQKHLEVVHPIFVILLTNHAIQRELCAAHIQRTQLVMARKNVADKTSLSLSSPLCRISGDKWRSRC